MVGNAQVYTISTNWPAAALYLTVGDGSHSANIGFHIAVTETAYVDAVAQTVRQVGSFSVVGGTNSTKFSETVTLPPVFPNPPKTVSGDLTLSLSVDSGGLSVPFDTGPQSVHWDALSGAYTLDGGAVSVNESVPINGSYSFMTGGQTYNGLFSYSLPLSGTINCFARMSTANYPASIYLYECAGRVPGGVQDMVAEIITANGFDIMLQAGTGELVIPEPSAWKLGTVGAIILCAFGRKDLRLRRRAASAKQ
jgi:hypothetical protein